MTNTTHQEWEERLDSTFKTYKGMAKNDPENPFWYASIRKHDLKAFIRTEIQKAEQRGRDSEKERILACGHAHEPVTGFQPYGFMEEERERTIFMDGFKHGRAMLLIDVVSKRHPRLNPQTP